MALFGRSKPEKPAYSGGGPIDPQWVRSASGAFYQLPEVDADELGLRSLSGVLLLWHGGIRPAWVWASESPSLGRAFDAVLDNREITQYHRSRGGLFVSWAVLGEEMRRGVVLYLTRALKPLVVNPRAPTEESAYTKPIPVILPGAKQASR